MVAFDAADARARLDAVTAQVEECRAAIDIAEDGDPTALEPMRDAVDAMAADLAILRAAVGGQDLANPPSR